MLACIRQSDPGHATGWRRPPPPPGCRLVLAAGGDGTLHEAANGLAGTDCVLAPLPAGTTNCLARELGLPQPDYGDPNWLISCLGGAFGRTGAADGRGRMQQRETVAPLGRGWHREPAGGTGGAALALAETAGLCRLCGQGGIAVS